MVDSPTPEGIAIATTRSLIRAVLPTLVIFAVIVLLAVTGSLSSRDSAIGAITATTAPLLTVIALGICAAIDAVLEARSASRPSDLATVSTPTTPDQVDADDAAAAESIGWRGMVLRLVGAVGVVVSGLLLLFGITELDVILSVLVISLGWLLAIRVRGWLQIVLTIVLSIGTAFTLVLLTNAPVARFLF